MNTSCRSGDDGRLAHEQAGELGRSQGAARLLLGGLLDRFEKLGGFRAHGLPGIHEYVVEVLGLSPRWCADASRMHRRLAQSTHVTHTRAALERGTIRWSMADALVRTAAPGFEADALARARHATVREVLGRSDRDGDATTTIDLRAPSDDVRAYEATRMLVRGMTGSGSDATAVEALLAETWTRLQTLRPEAARSVSARLAERGTGPPTARCPEGVEAPLPEVRLPTASLHDPRDIDEVLVDLANTIATRDVELGAAACAVMRYRTWRALGYPTFAAWCESWVGMSLPAVKKRMTLARRLDQLGEPLRQALAEGRLGLERACLVARVATRTTIEEWVRRAEVAR